LNSGFFNSSFGHRTFSLVVRQFKLRKETCISTSEKKGAPSPETLTVKMRAVITIRAQPERSRHLALGSNDKKTKQNRSTNKAGSFPR
ncbi:MAG: hypothetical protein Q4G68_12865, partial [Planctomycetia bacterium]|nr:hypothetical protein [Planctomycetia bacterium]